MMVSDSRRVVVVTPPKTGSTSIHAALRGVEDWRDVGGQHAIPVAGEFDGFRILASIRDTVSRAISLAWHNHRQERPLAPFNEDTVRGFLLDVIVHADDVDAFFGWSCHDWLRSVSVDAWFLPSKFARLDLGVDELPRLNVQGDARPHIDRLSRRRLRPLAERWAPHDAAIVRGLAE